MNIIVDIFSLMGFFLFFVFIKSIIDALISHVHVAYNSSTFYIIKHYGIGSSMMVRRVPFVNNSFVSNEIIYELKKKKSINLRYYLRVLRHFHYDCINRRIRITRHKRINPQWRQSDMRITGHCIYQHSLKSFKWHISVSN